MAWNSLKKGRYSVPQGEYFVTFNCDKKYPVFCEFEVAKLFCAQISKNEMQHSCCWFTWVLMPDHFHGLVRLGDDSNLSQVVAGLKGTTSRNVNLVLQSECKLWQAGFYDRALRKEEDRKAIARYIIANPLRKGLVKQIADYPFWNSIYL